MAFNYQNKKRPGPPLYTSFGETPPPASRSKKMKKVLEEEDVFIREYVNRENKGFTGTIKVRYADFQVNEIDKDGNLVQLTNFDPPVYPSDLEVPDIDAEKIKELLSEEEITKIAALKDLPPNQKESVEIEVTNFDKEQRTFLHKYVKLIGSNTLNSNTLDKPDGKKFIEVNTKKKSRAEIRRSNAKKIKFLHFTLMKTNTETSEMLFLLGKQFSKKVNKFQIAGTKDKRAVTSQRVSCKYLNYSDIDKLTLNRIKLGNFEYKEHPLQLGDLKGNFFRIAIRGVTATDETIEETMTLFKENGFINYFGLQRFGNNAEAATHDVGRLLLQNNWRAAVQLILRPVPVQLNTPPKIQKIEYLKQRYAQSKSAAMTLRGCDDVGFLKSCIEARILVGLARHGENAFLNALENITRNTATLYLHAYQSYIWNRVVSERIKKFGKEIQVGDLVLVEVITPEIPPVKEPKPESMKERREERRRNRREDEEEDEEDDDEEEIIYDVPAARANIHVVTAEDIARAAYTLADVVYPCPGYDVKLPENEIGSWYYDYLKEDNLDMESFRSSVKLFSLTGSYRKIVLKAPDVAWSIIRHDLPDDDILLSDACKLANRTLSEFKTKSLKAVAIEMTLPPGVYATMALREVMKCSAYAAHQRTPVSSVPIPVVQTEEGAYIDY
uniref:Pseudouridylate synthase 7 homolog n=1 Tax=Cacopsylla melanoneura TaxID=428564 RepID=A0A8D8LSR6_9HEMI